MLGDMARGQQSVANNTTNTMRKFAPNQWVSGYDVPQGMTLNTPQVWRNGVRGQYYDPSAATYNNPVALGTSKAAGNKPSSGIGGVVGDNSYRMGTPSYPSYQTPTNYGSTPGVANVTTSITPSGIYPEWMTNAAVNQVQAQADQASNLPYLMKMFDRPGASRSDAHMAAALPYVAQAQTQATAGRAGIPFEDMMANQRNVFMGQVARENEALQLSNLAARMQEAQQSSYFNDLNRQYSLLSSLIG